MSENGRRTGVGHRPPRCCRMAGNSLASARRRRRALGRHRIGDLFHRWSPPAGVTERATTLGDCVTYRRLDDRHSRPSAAPAPIASATDCPNRAPLACRIVCTERRGARSADLARQASWPDAALLIIASALDRHIGDTQGWQPQWVPWPLRRVLLVRHGETEWNVAAPATRPTRLAVNATRKSAHEATGLGDAQRASMGSSPARSGGPTARHSSSTPRSGAVWWSLRNLLRCTTALSQDSRTARSRHVILASWCGVSARSTCGAFRTARATPTPTSARSLALQRIASHTATAPLLVTHEMIGRMLLRTLLNLTPEDTLEWSMPHGAVIEIVPRDSRVTIRHGPAPG